MDQTWEERDEANRDKVQKFLELQEQSNTKGPAAFHEFNTKFYDQTGSWLLAGTEWVLGTKAKQSSAAQTEARIPAGHGEGPIKDIKCDEGVKRWQ